VVFTTPAVRALKRRFPDARITYLVEPAAEPVVRHNPHIDTLRVVERPRGLARLRYDWTLARELRRQRFDLAIDLHGGPRAAWLTRASGAPIRIGYDLPGRAWAYTTRVPWTRALVPPRHSVLNQWDLLRPLGLDAADPAADAVQMPLAPDAVVRVAARLHEAGVPDSAAIAVLHVSAGNPFRRWPADRFAALAAALTTLPDPMHVVMTSGPSEAEAVERVARAARDTPSAEPSRVVHCGEFDLSELAALVSRARLYIGGDSGPLHIAATTRTPVVALFGPTLPERSLPWRDPAVPSIAVDAGSLPCRPCHQRSCVPGDFRCLGNISVPMVVAACHRALGTG
jgi:predicted lipopolysaccharide heptosyltransferase III